jgi:glutathione synthase/RimK-type ligase-like ATP-grasp enzyme
MSWEAYQRELASLRTDERETTDAKPLEPAVDLTLGVVREFSGSHMHYVRACRELRVPCKVVDLSGPDWIENVRSSGCDAFLIRPEYLVSQWKLRQDERLRVMTRELGLRVFPSPDELWPYESKRRTLYWLEANGIPHPRAWVFYSKSDALGFAHSVELPVVFKTDFGSAGAGVRILRSRSQLRRVVKRCFGRGHRLPNSHPSDRQWGSVFLQEYVPGVREWRAIRVGRSFFALEKLKRGEFHSGSGTTGWGEPPPGLLDMIREITERAGFASMSFDVFVTTDGDYLVNEMHTFFASPNPYKMRIGGKTGRYLHEGGAWRFEEGTFFENAGCNLRVEALLDSLSRKSVG